MRKRLLLVIIFLLSISTSVFSIKFTLENLKEVYDNEDEITYTLKIENNETETFKGRIDFLIGALESSYDASSKKGLVFKDIKNNGTREENSDLGNFSNSGSLIVNNLEVGVGEEVTYTTTAIVRKGVKDNINVKASLYRLDDEIGVISTYEKLNSMERLPYNYTVSKSSLNPYYEKGGEIEYKVIIKNTGSFLIKNMRIEDVIDENIFENISITSEIVGNLTDEGIYIDGNDNLSVREAIVDKGGSLTYIIKARVKEDYTEEINNTVKVSVREEDKRAEVGPLNLATYNYNLNLESISSTYKPGEKISYNLSIKNNSDLLITRMNLLNDLAEIMTTDARNNSISAFDLTKNISLVKGNNGSGDIDTDSNILIENISIEPNKTANYILEVYVNKDAVGDIENSIEVIDRSGDNKIELANIVTSVKGEAKITKEAISNGEYKPGDEIVYNLKVENIGEGILYGINIVDEISKLESNLANLSSESAEDKTGNPAYTWKIKASLGQGSIKSSSILLDSSGEIKNKNLDDEAIIYPEESINYEISIKTKDTAIAEIKNKGFVKQGTKILATSNEASYMSSPTLTPSEIEKSIKISKTSIGTTYTPGEELKYEITVVNNSYKLANNISIKDKISEIMSSTYKGETDEEPVFTNWKLRYISKSGQGSIEGEFDYDQFKTGDLDILADIGPNGQIKYELIGVVNPNITGKIFDDVSLGNDDNVKEAGNGLKMAPYKLEVAKDVNKTEYIPGQPVIYTIKIKNTGEGSAINIPVKDEFSKMKTNLVTDEEGLPYIETSTTAKIYKTSNETPVTSPPDDSGISGILKGDIDTFINLSPGNTLEYTIEATLNPFADEKIINKVNVNDNLVSDKGIISRPTSVSVSKAVNPSTLPNNLNSVGEKISNEVITYELSITNSDTSGIAMNIPVKDKISEIKSELLEAVGGKTEDTVFTSWEVNLKEAIGEGTKISGKPIKDNEDIDTMVDIAPSGKITFEIIGKVDSSLIFYGPIVNKASAEGQNTSATTNPKLPFLKVYKSSEANSYTSGENLTYTIRVENKGKGYSNDATILDTLKDTDGNEIFDMSTVTITPTMGGYGTRVGNVGDNTIDETVDIAPGGYIEYVVSGTVKEGKTGVLVSRVEVEDVQHNNTSTASISLHNSKEDDNDKTIFVRKGTSSPAINPQGEFSYYIDITNNTVADITDITIEDKISEIIGNLANKNDGSLSDTTGKAFTSWKIYRQGIEVPELENKDITGNIGSLPGKSTIRYEIRGIPDERLLSQELTNTVKIKREDGTTQQSYIDVNVLGSSGGVSRSVNRDRYKPGDYLEYIITVSPNGEGYLNNFDINEEIKDLNVELLGGGTGNVFNDDFKVEYISSQSKVSQGTVIIPTSSIQNNENLSGRVDIKPDDKLVYKISGYVRKDIGGNTASSSTEKVNIEYKGLVTEPYRHNLNLSTYALGGNYVSGEELELVLRIENNSKGNANNMDVSNELKNLKVMGSDGVEVPAFVGDITLDDILTDGGEFTTTTATTGDLSTGKLNAKADIPVNGWIEYRVKGKMNPLATGRLTNEFVVDGDTASAGITSPEDKFKLTKTFVNYLDKDMKTKLPNGYTPDGYIEYSILIDNTSKGILDDYPVIDEISKIEGELTTGRGQVFENWKIIVEMDEEGKTSKATKIVSGNLGSDFVTDDINQLIDIGPLGFIKYTIIGKLKDNVVGSFQNEVIVNGISRSSEVAKSASEAIVHTKNVYSNEGCTTLITKYEPGDIIYYKVSLENKGKGISYGHKFKDSLSSIKANIAQDSTNIKENPFEEIKVSHYVIKSATDNITTIGSFSNIGKTTNIESADIDIDDMIIASGGKIEFIIEAKIKEGVFGGFENVSVYNNNSQKARLTSYPPQLKASNTLIKLDGETYTNQKYEPGDEVEYELVISNTGKGVLNNLSVEDIISNIKSEQVGGSLEEALENIEIRDINGNKITNTNDISKSKIGSSNPTTSTYIWGSLSDEKISLVTDLGPKEEVKIIIKGKIKDTSLGEISSNNLKVGGKTIKSATIIPELPIISGSKTLIKIGSMDITNGQPLENQRYKSGDKILYKLTLENNGLGYGDNIVLKDEIKNIVTEIVGQKNGRAFSSFEIKEINKINLGRTPDLSDNTDILTPYEKTQGLDTTVDLAPKSKLEVMIEGVVALNAVGEILNSATLGSKTYKSEPINLEPVRNINDVIITKTSPTDKYLPDGNISYEIRIKNNSDTIANDIYLTNILSNLKTEQAGGSQGLAFKSGAKVSYNIQGDKTNSAAVISPTGDINKGRIDLAPGAEIIVTVSGEVSSTSLDDIISTPAILEYGSDSKQTGIQTHSPYEGSLIIDKTSSLDEYIPGEYIDYTINVKNTGKGYINDGEIKDEIKKIKVIPVDSDTPVPAFSDITITETTGTSNTKLGSPNEDANGYLQKLADIYPGDTVKVKIRAKVSEKAYGDIINLGSVKYEKTKDGGYETKEVEKITSSRKSLLEAVKSVDKLNYRGEDTLIYTIKIKNTGKGWAKDIEVIDELSQITTDFVSGSGQLAFVANPNLDKIKTLNGSTYNNEAINIEPGGTVTLTYSGKIKPHAVGRIKNTASLTYKEGKNDATGGVTINTNEVISSPFLADLSVTKTSDKNYELGSVVTYKIEIENTSSNAANVDFDSPILDWLVENNKGETNYKAYKDYKITKLVLPNESLMSNVATNKIIVDKDIEIDGSLRVGEKIEIIFEATLNETENLSPMEEIVGESTLIQDKSGSLRESILSTTVEPYEASLSLDKVIKTVGNLPYTSGMIYNPGDEITYEIKLENQGLGYSGYEDFKDMVKDLQVDLAGNGLGQVIEDITWKVETTSKKSKAKNDNVLEISNSIFTNGENGEIEINIAPKSQIIITLQGRISNLATGEIPGNTAEFGDLEETTPGLKPQEQDYSLTKKILDTNIYSPEGEIKYEVVIENKSSAYLTDAIITDELSEIKAYTLGGEEIGAFESWEITKEVISKVSNYPSFTKKTYPSTSNLEDEIDLAPYAKMKFIITASLAKDIYGEIKNTVKLVDKEKNEVTKEVIIDSKKAELTIKQEPLNPTYSPGGNIGFLITVENISGAVASNYNVKDLLKDIKVNSVNGEIYPFAGEGDIKLTYSILPTIDGSGNYELVDNDGEISVTGDLGPSSKLYIEIKGIAKNFLTGDIENKVVLTYNEDQQVATAIIKPVGGDLEIEKLADITEFTPGQSVVYTIKLKNNGEGYLSNVSIKDDLEEIGSFDLDETSLGTVTETALSKVSEIALVNGVLLAKADIYPKESISINIKTKVLESQKDKIVNKVVATYNDETYEDEVEIASVPSSLSITKSQNNETYTHSSQHAYTLTIKNEGNGWAKDVEIIDNIGNIDTEYLGNVSNFAFEKSTINASVLEKGQSEIDEIIKDNEGNIKVLGSIAPNSTVKISIKAKIVSEALGLISNKGSLISETEVLETPDVIATQETGEITLTKDGNLAEYGPGQEMVYTILVKNNTNINLNNVKIIDKLSYSTGDTEGLKVKNRDGNFVQALEDNWTITSTASEGVKDIQGLPTSGDIDVTRDIPADGWIKFVIRGKVISDATSVIENEARTEQEVDNGSGGTKKQIQRGGFDSEPKPYEIEITKKAVDEDGNEVLTYTPNKDVIYQIKVENTGLGYGRDIKVTDLLDQVYVNIPGKGKELAFNMNEVEIKVIDHNGEVYTTLDSNLNDGTEEITYDKNLEDLVDLPSGGSITYEIKALVRENAVGEIGGDAKADTKTDDAPLTSEPALIKASMYIDKDGDTEIIKDTYIPGEEATYYIEIKNEGQGYGYNIDAEHIITSLEGKSIVGGNVPVFDEFKIYQVDSLGEVGSLLLTTEDLEESNLSVGPNKSKIYKVVGKVNKGLIGIIKPESQVVANEQDETFNLEVEFMPPEPNLIMSKEAEKDSYEDSDTEMIYNLSIKNIANGNLDKVKVEDIISKLKDEKSGNLLFTTWEVISSETGEKINDNLTYGVDKDIVDTIKLKSKERNIVTYKIIGTLNKGLDNNVVNVFKAEVESLEKDEEPYKKEVDTSTYVKKIPDNEGELEVIKRAMKSSTKVGEPVEYEVVIENKNESRFIGVYLKDLIPSGFRYVKGSSEILYAGPNEKFDDKDDEVETKEPVVTSSLKYELPVLEPYSKYRVRYILIPSLGVGFGKYKNQAYVTLENERISNIASATVSIKGDELLDTASMIGKVFYDHNKNGYQDEKEAGIPGVRLISPRGIIAVTDRFGRYHMPDQWVYNKLGQNAEIKLDITTLPENTKVISENPMIKRISSAALTKFNFSVVVEEGKFAVDTTRIYLKYGAIWIVNDFVDLESELNLSLPEKALVKNRRLAEPIDFTIETNYADFIKKYEVAIYSQNNRLVKSIKGNNLYNDMVIVWDDMESISEFLVPGKELKVRLTVWDKHGRMDKTEIGYIDLVARKSILDLFNYDTRNDVSLLSKNIKLNGNLVRIVGDGLKDVSSVIIKDDEYSIDDNEFLGMRFIPSEETILPVKVVYEDGREENYELTTKYKETYFLGTGMIDLSFGKYHVSGNEEVLQVDNPYGANYYEDKIYREGRLAIFGKGRYKDKLRFTTHIDTKARDIKDMFDDVFEKDDQTIFERVQDTDTYYYPTYGDKAYIYRHVDTDGDIYFKAEYEDSYLMWGNYETEMNHAKYMNYNRDLYGAKLDYISSNKTDYGDSDKLIAFMSKPYSLFGHDEFLGTGGSLYFLKNNDVLNGSEKVYIKVVNSKTDRTESIKDLVEGRDYEFDPYQGRIILSEPLKSLASSIDDGIIQDSASGDYYNYLVVDYEYIPSSDEGLSEKDYGFYGEKFLGKHLGIGGTYIKENRDGVDYRMKGAELTLKFTEKSYIKGEVSESEGIQSNNSFVSLDGGLIFIKKGLDDPTDVTGRAYNGEIVINLNDIAPNVFGSFGNELTGWYEEKDAGYSFASNLDDNYIKSYGSRLTLKYSDKMKSTIKYEEYEEREGINRIRGELKDKYRAISAEVEYLLTDRLVSSFAYKYIKELADDDTMVAANIIGMRLEYEVNDDLTIYAEGQGTISRDEGYEVNNRGEIGFDADLTDYLSISASTSLGTRGNYSEFGLDYDVTDKYSIYIGGTKDGEENQDDLTFGQKVEINDKLDFYQESQVLKEDGRSGRADNYGLDYDYNDDLTIGASFQYGKIELPDDEGEARRKAISIYADYDTFDLEWRTKFEYREDKEDGSSEKIRQYLTTNYLDYVYDEEITFGGKFNYAYTDDNTKNESNKFIEGSVGMAYRPIDNDRLNYLARYTFILNDDPNDSESLKAHIAEFEAICEAGERLDLGLKLAYRDEEETYLRESGNEITVENALYLIGLRANYVILNDWDIYLEYHWLIERHTHDVRDGAIVGIYKNVHQNLKIGGGYNFSGFSSDLSDEDYESHGWFINIVGRF